MVENFDVVVVGAGPAGSCLAKKVAEAGFSVMIYERREEIGVPKRCGEGLAQTGEKLIGKIPSRAVCQYVRGARIYAPNGRYLEADMVAAGEEGGYILDRKIFDKWLATEAVKAGAHLQTATLITSLIKEGGRIAGIKGRYLGDDFETHAKVVVAATGAESPLASQSGLRTVCNPRLVDTCLQYEMANIECDDRFIHIYLGSELAPRGYAWVFPKGNKTANVGVGIVPNPTGKTAQEYLDAFVKSRPELSKGGILEVNAGAVPVGDLLKDMATDGFIVCGEAAHHVNPIHGGGIKEAIISGQIAADVIIDAIKKNDVSKKSLSLFNEKWWMERGNHLQKVEKLREVFEKMSDSDLNSLVDALKPDDVIAFSRGERLGTLAKIMMRKPSLIALARHLI